MSSCQYWITVKFNVSDGWQLTRSIFILVYFYITSVCFIADLVSKHACFWLPCWEARGCLVFCCHYTRLLSTFLSSLTPLRYKVNAQFYWDKKQLIFLHDTCSTFGTSPSQFPMVGVLGSMIPVQDLLSVQVIPFRVTFRPGSFNGLVFSFRC